MATVNAITKLEFTLEDGNSDQVAFSIDLDDLVGVDNVLNLLERVRFIPRLASIPALAVLEGLRVNLDCVRGLDDKGLCILSKLSIDLASLHRVIQRVETGGLLCIDIQDLDIHHLVGIEKYNVILKRKFEELYPTNETSESTTERRYANTGFFGGIEVSKTSFFDLQADATSKVFGRAPQEYHSKDSFGKPFGQFDAFEPGKLVVVGRAFQVGDGTSRVIVVGPGVPVASIANNGFGRNPEGYCNKGYFDEARPFFHGARDQFGAVNHDKFFVDIGHTVNGGNTPHKVIVVDVGNPLNTTASGKFDHILEGYLHKAAIRAGIDQLDAVIHAGFDQFDAIKLVESFLDIGHTLEGRNTCHGAFEVIELVKSIVDIGHTLKGGDTSNEIANDLPKWHPAEALPLGVTAGPCAVF